MNNTPKKRASGKRKPKPKVETVVSVETKKRTSGKRRPKAKASDARTLVFAYRGIVGILSSDNGPSFRTSFRTVRISDVDVSHEALALLRLVPPLPKLPGEDQLCDVGCVKRDGEIFFSWHGGAHKAFRPEDVECDSETDWDLIVAKDGVNPPGDFKSFVETIVPIKSAINQRVRVSYPPPLDKEVFTIIGERVTQYEIRGDFSAGTHSISQSEWIDKTMVKEWIV